MSPADGGVALRPVWLSHHHARDSDRTVRVGGVHLCRRCLGMFAGAGVALLLHTVLSFEAQIGDVALVAAMSGYAAHDFVQVARGRRRYSARRVLVTSPFTGVVLAWSGVTGFRDGLGVAHLVLGAVALGLLLLLVADGARSRPVPQGR